MYSSLRSPSTFPLLGPAVTEPLSRAKYENGDAGDQLGLGKVLVKTVDQQGGVGGEGGT